MSDLDRVSGGDYLIMNPAAIGDPDADPGVLLGPSLIRLLRPCGCGGVNGYHTEDCGKATP